MGFRLRRGEARVLNGTVDQDGYRRVHLCNGPLRKIRGVHQLVAEAFLMHSWFEGAIVLHGPENDNSNNAVTNLRWGTHADNTADRALHGTLGLSRSADEIREIRRLYAMGFQQREIARVFRTTQSYVHQIVARKQRKDVA